MYELFPNKEVLKYNHIGLNNITNGICKINTVDKLHVQQERETEVLMPVTGHASYDFKKSITM